MANATISGVTGGIGNGIPPVGNNNPNPNPNPPNVGAINTRVLGLMNKIERKVYQSTECLKMRITPEHGSNAIGSAVGALQKGSIIHAIDVLEIEAFDSPFTLGDEQGDEEFFLGAGETSCKEPMILNERKNFCVYFNAKPTSGLSEIIVLFSNPTTHNQDF
ncbi:MAG: hypothetical protein K2N12_06275 [Helicobacter sp.]|nr:hypothetical protein [Helicobacter sp.]